MALKYAVGAFVVNRDEPRPLGITLGIAAMTIVIAGVGLLLFALEGAICVVMGVPLALAGAVVGLSRSRSSLVACSRT